MPKGSRISGTGRRWSAGPSPNRKLDSGFADEPFQLERRRVAESPFAWLSANAAQKTEGKFSCLQTPEISQNRETTSRRRGHEDASGWKPAMTEGAERKSSRTALGQRGAKTGGKLFLPANP
jgi:hypothetical protein